MYKALIFDFEGTLVSFAWDLIRAVAEVKEFLAKRGIIVELENYAEIYNFVASNYPEYLSAVDAIYDKYDELAFKKWKVKEGVRETLEALGVDKAILSNINRDTLRRALEKFHLKDHFKLILGRRDVPLLKPSPVGILRILRELKIDKREVLFIGDSKSDVEACRKAGISVAVLEGESKFTELKADYKLNSFSDILSLPIQGL